MAGTNVIGSTHCTRRRRGRAAARGWLWLALALTACSPQAPTRVPAETAAPSLAPEVRAEHVAAAGKAWAEGRLHEASQHLAGDIQKLAMADQWRYWVLRGEVGWELGDWACVDDAVAQLAEAPAPWALSRATLRARLAWARGQRSAAFAALEPFASEPGVDACAARQLLASYWTESGEAERANAIWNDLVQLGERSEVAALRCAAAGARGSARPKVANEILGRAEALAPRDRHVLADRASLFLERHAVAEARDVLRGALAAVDQDAELWALQGQVQLEYGYDFDAARESLSRAYAVNARHPRARVLEVQLLMRDQEYGAAAQRIDEALAIYPGDATLWSYRAAGAWLTDDSDAFAAARARVAELQPGGSTIYRVLADAAEWEHRYDELIPLLREGVRVAPHDARLLEALGVNQLRAGRRSAGVLSLQSSFRLDSFNPRVFRLLQLFEEQVGREFVTHESPHFQFLWPRAEGALLELYVPDLMEKAWSEFSASYGTAPEGTTTVEIYADRGQFSVRATGQPWVLLQGVCFGRSLATFADAREPFNLGMTLWHELAHVFHLRLSRNRVPRWLTEGLAEWETLSARPEWSRPEERQLYESFRAGELPKIADWNRAFSHADSQLQMEAAYVGAARLLEGWGKRHGRAALARTVAGFASNADVASVLAGALQEDLPRLDAAFQRDLEQRFVSLKQQFVPLRPTGNWEWESRRAAERSSSVETLARLAAAASRAGRREDAQRLLQQLEAQAPNDPNLWYQRAERALAERDSAGAGRALARLEELGADGYDTARLRWSWARQAGDGEAELLALRDAARWDPAALEPRRRILEASADASPAVREMLLREMLPLARHDPEPWKQLIRLLMSERRHAEAEAVADGLLWVALLDPETHGLRAEVFRAVGKPAEEKKSRRAEALARALAL